MEKKKKITAERQVEQRDNAILHKRCIDRVGIIQLDEDVTGVALCERVAENI